jgi:putative ABC transport system permease protein
MTRADPLLAAIALLCVRALLLLYPPSFRRRFREGMLADFRDRFDERALRGRLALTALLVRTVADLSVSALREWNRPSEAVAHTQNVSSSSVSRKGRIMDHLRLDLRFALRSLARRPGFTAIAVITLGLGIGANTAIFSVVNGVLLRPLAYLDPDRLVMIWAHGKDDPAGRGSMSAPDIASIRELSVVTAAEGYSSQMLTLTGAGEPEQIQAARVTGGLLAAFGLTPVIGRDIRQEENNESAQHVVVIGHDYWQTRLGGRMDVIGSSIELSEQSYEVVGVAPPEFDYPDGAQLWVPHRTGEGCGRGCHVFRAIGKLTSGVRLERANAELSRLAASLSDEYPDSNFEKGLRFEQLEQFVVGDVRDGLWILLGAVGVVLLIACTNVANLLLVRASTRTGEVAVRAALGASRGRIAAQVLVEGFVLALGGAALGLILAVGGVGLLRRTSPGTVPRIDEISVDGTVLLFSLGVTLLVALLFGLSPALRLARTPLAEVIRTEARGGQVAREAWSRGVLLSVEVGLSLMLLVGAGLLLRSLGRLYDVELGFDGREVSRFSLALPHARYSELEPIASFYQALEDRVSTLPGVESVGSVFGAPLARGNITGEVRLDGQPEPARGTETYASLKPATSGYFRAMRLALLRGRPIEPTDRAGTVPVAVVNETFARENFGDEDPLGKRFSVTASFGYADPTWTIVGIVRDVRRNLKAELQPEVYVPHAQFGPGFLVVHVRGRPGIRNLMPAIREQVRSLDPNLPLQDVETVAEAIRRDAAPTRFYLMLVSLFAALAVILAAIGLYGVVAYLVSRRTREIGIRLALGAPRVRITRLILRQGMFPALLGVAGGLAASVSASRVMESLLFNVEPADPTVLTGVAVLVLTIAIAASVLPAWRAARMDPAEVLRRE